MDVNLYELLGRPVVLYDLETSGLDPQGNRVIELAAIRWDKQGRLPFESLLNPGVQLSSEITKLTGITQEQVDAAPPAAEVWAQFRDFLNGVSLLVAHNAPFDLSFLAAELQRNGLPSKSADFICTNAVAVMTGTGIKRPNRGGYMQLGTKLPEVAEALGLTLEGAHRAGADIAMTEMVLPHLIQRAKEQCRPILNSIIHRQWLIEKGKARPDYVPPRAIVYTVA